MEAFDDLFDDDEDLLEFLEYERRPYTLKPRTNPFEELDDVDFFTRFRLKKHTVLFLLGLIEEQIESLTDRNHSVTPMNKLLLTLRFYATGSFLITLADFMCVSKASACNIVHSATDAIASLCPRFIKFPATEEELSNKQQEFYTIASLPRVIGSIDCTHIRIQSPGGNNAEVFRNRKGYFSINVQTIADKSLRIMDIVARWPGAVHDQTILENSNIKRRLERHEFGNCLLVADSGYQNTMHVITPLLEANTEVQQLYNESVRRTRNPVERQYGVWKRRFPVLALGLRLKLESSLVVIVACAVLHNIAIDYNEDIPPNELDIVGDRENCFNEDVEVEPQAGVAFANARDFLLNNYFPGLLNH